MDIFNSDTKNQHYVPQFLLKKFSFNDKEQIYAYDKIKQSPFITNVRNVASENHFYDLIKDDEKISFESLFTELETKFSVICNKIIELGTIKELNNEEKEW